jgi:two-component system, response regulator PdtaR
VSKSLSVVIAEDEALIRLDLKEMLEEEGYLVAGEVGDGAAAVDLASQLRPDLVIMDVKMPGLDGISAAEQISAQRLAPVVILTAFSQRDLVKRASDAGAMAYLIKPFTKADLVPAIEVAVSRYQEISALDSEVAGLRERLEVRKLLDRAKGLLQAGRGMSEAEAFRWIQKTSMDRRLTMRAVAEEVLRAGTEIAPDAPARGDDPAAPAAGAPGTGAAGSAAPGQGSPGPSGPPPASAARPAPPPSAARPGPGKPGPGTSAGGRPGAAGGTSGGPAPASEPRPGTGDDGGAGAGA